MLASGKSANPQTFNRYVYVINNPLAYTDPTGLQIGGSNERCRKGERCESIGTYNERTKTITPSNPNMGEVIIQMVDDTFEAVNSFLGQLIEQPSSLSGMAERGQTNYYSKSGGSFFQPGNQVVRNSFLSFAEGNRQLNSGLKAVDPTGIVELNETTVMADFGKASSTDLLLAYGNFTINTATTAFGGGTSRKLYQEGGELVAEKGGFNLALGLSQNLDEFAKRTNSTTYFQKYGNGFIDSRFIKLAEEAKVINFNMGSRNGGNLFSIRRFADWQRRGQPDEFEMITNFELDHILSRPELRRKTNFFVFPSQ